MLLALISFILVALVTMGLVVTFSAHTQVSTATKSAKTSFSISAIPIFVFLVHFALTGQWGWAMLLVAGILAGWIGSRFVR